MNHPIKCSVYFLLFICIIACKSEIKEVNTLGANTEVSGTHTTESNTVNNTSETASSTNTAADAMSAKTNATSSNVEINTNPVASTNTDAAMEEAEKPARKKTSFNPPHIAVLEQGYQEEIKAKKKASKAEKLMQKPDKQPQVAHQMEKESKLSKSNATRVNSTVNTAPSKAINVPVSSSGTSATATAAKTSPVSTPAPSSSSNKLTELVFKRNFYSFGDIMQGDTVKFSFDFTNIGESPLVIESAKGSCSCTLPEYPINAIAPGESGKITGIYVSEGKQGPQNASVTLTSNTSPSTHQLLLDGTVLMPKEGEDKGM